jgi:flagellar motor switch protein FliN
VSVETDLAVFGPAAAEAASLLSEALELNCEPGPGFDLWGQEPGELAPLLSPQAKAWSVPLVGPLGPCGELGVSLAPGVPVPEQLKVTSALAGSVRALNAVCGADRIGDIQPCSAETLAQARPGLRALGVPLSSAAEPLALLVIVMSTSQPAELPHLDPSSGTGGQTRSIVALGDVEMTISVELGRTKLPIRDLLTIHNGAVVQLDRAVTHPVDIFVHGTLIARGEVVVVDDCFAVRVTELLTGD